MQRCLPVQRKRDDVGSHAAKRRSVAGWVKDGGIGPASGPQPAFGHHTLRPRSLINDSLASLFVLANLPPGPRPRPRLSLSSITRTSTIWLRLRCSWSPGVYSWLTGRVSSRRLSNRQCIAHFDFSTSHLPNLWSQPNGQYIARCGQQENGQCLARCAARGHSCAIPLAFQMTLLARTLAFRNPDSDRGGMFIERSSFVRFCFSARLWPNANQTKGGYLLMVLVRIKPVGAAALKNKKNLCEGCGFYKHATPTGVFSRTGISVQRPKHIGQCIARFGLSTPKRINAQWNAVRDS